MLSIQKRNVAIAALAVTALFLLGIMFPAVAASTGSGTPKVISQGTKYIGSFYDSQNGETYTVTMSWTETEVTTSNSDPTYYFTNQISIGCGVGTDWADQEGSITSDGVNILSYWPQAETWQGYTGLGCGLQYQQSQNWASLTGGSTGYVEFYTSGTVCEFLVGFCSIQLQNYYQDQQMHPNGEVVYSDWTS
jgi:hypothetical protein